MNAKSRSMDMRLWLLIAAHIPLVLLFSEPRLGLIHAIGVVGYGLLTAVSGRNPERAVFVAAYVMGAEVLWRMTKVPVFWETGKYAVVLILGLAGSRMRAMRGPRMPFLYFALLIPSCLVTLMARDLGTFKDEVSFNLSGPLALVTSIWFFSRVRLDRDDVRRLLLVMIAPMVSILTIAALASRGSGVEFSDTSNFSTSGGFGPNQVSSILGLGALCGLMLLGDRSLGKAFRIVAGGLAILLAAQSALTFSRGGIYGAAGAAVAFLLVQMTGRRDRIRVLVGAGVLLALAEGLVLPTLEARTAGKLAERFRDTKTSGRDQIAKNEVAVFFTAPLLGLGPGGAQEYRLESRPVAAHTEYTRLLAEHGVFGLAAGLIMIFMAIGAVRAAPSGQARSFAAALVVWSLLFMTHAGMRLVAPSFLLGLVAADLSALSREGRRRDAAPAPLPALVAASGS